VTADRRFDAGAQLGRRCVPWQPLTHQLLQGLNACPFGGERRLRAHLLLDRQRVRRVELAVHIGMDQQDRLIVRIRTGHGLFQSHYIAVRAPHEVVGQRKRRDYLTRFEMEGWGSRPYETRTVLDSFPYRSAMAVAPTMGMVAAIAPAQCR
jgi:hypothetical protein